MKMTIHELEKMTQSNYVGTRQIKLADELIFGDSDYHILEFDIFDGFAYCGDYNGLEIYMRFPKKELVKTDNVISENAREFLKLNKNVPLTEEHLLACYNSLYVNN
jgi:hypothetical protein